MEIQQLSKSHGLNSTYVKEFIKTHHGAHYIPVYSLIIKNFEKLTNTTYEQFLQRTGADFRVLACRIGDNDCKRDWKRVSVYEGYCMQLLRGFKKFKNSKLFLKIWYFLKIL